MPVYRQKMVDLPEKARILAIDCGGVLSCTTDDVKYDDDKIYKAAMEGAYCFVQLYKFKTGRWPQVVSRVNFPSNKHWVRRFCRQTFGIPDGCIHLVREKAEKGPVCAQLGATAVVDDSYDALYAMGTGAWETLASAVLFQEQGKPLSKQGLWDSWLLENKIEFAGNMLELMVALGIARTMTQAEEYQSQFSWGPPTNPHSEDLLETALAVIRGIPQAVQAREAEVASAADADAHGVDYSADDQASGASVAKAAAAAPAKAPLAAAAKSAPPPTAAAPANASPPVAAAAASEAAPPPKHAAAPANAPPPVAAAAKSAPPAKHAAAPAANASPPVPAAAASSPRAAAPAPHVAAPATAALTLKQVKKEEEAIDGEEKTSSDDDLSSSSSSEEDDDGGPTAPARLDEKRVRESSGSAAPPRNKPRLALGPSKKQEEQDRQQEGKEAKQAMPRKHNDDENDDDDEETRRGRRRRRRHRRQNDDDDDEDEPSRRGSRKSVDLRPYKCNADLRPNEDRAVSHADLQKFMKDVMTHIDRLGSGAASARSSSSAAAPAASNRHRPTSGWSQKKLARAQAYEQAKQEGRTKPPPTVTIAMCKQCGRNQPGSRCVQILCRQCCQDPSCAQHGR